MAGKQNRSLTPPPPPRGRKPARKPISPERLAGLAGIRELIDRGYYNSEAVLDDITASFTKAVSVLL